MGIFSPFSKHSSETDNYSEPTIYKTPSRQSDCSKNPNPSEFEILRKKRVGRFVVIFIKYPNCTNYEGKKILVFEGTNVKHVTSQKIIDPHFTDLESELPLVARFKPTEEGWRYAIGFCENISKK